MKRISLAGMSVYCILTIGLLTGIKAQASLIEVSVATDKPAYVPGELLIVGVTAYNPNDYDVTLNFPSSRQAWYSMDGVYDYPVGGFDVLTSRTIPAYGSYTWSLTHHWSEYFMSLGTHSVVGNVGGYFGSISSSPVTFDVIEPTLPTSDFMIDFTHLPDGRTLPSGVSLENAYAGWGVHFGTYRNGGVYDIGIDTSDDNQYAVVNQTSYPPGFNIFAQFDMPVYEVAADVSSAAGVSLTMVAKDATGQVIGSVTSDPVPAVREFLGPIELETTTPIATLEWWPSNDHASVMVDNLFVGVTAPPLPGDLNGDGFVGLKDLNIVLDAWNQFTLLETMAADPSADGYVGLDDLDIVLDNWNAGTQPPQAVPEPAALLLFGLGCAVTSLRARH